MKSPENSSEGDNVKNQALISLPAQGSVKPCVCGSAESMTRSSSTHISFLSSEGDRVRGLLHRRILAALLFPSPPLLQYYSLVKICLKQETKAVQSLRNHNDEHLRL